MGESNLGIGNLNIGFSQEGLVEYKNNLQIELIQGTKEILEANNSVKEAISQGWQGVSRDKFLEQLDETIKKIEDDLDSEYQDLMARLAEVENNYFEQDNNLMNS